MLKSKVNTSSLFTPLIPFIFSESQNKRCGSFIALLPPSQPFAGDRSTMTSRHSSSSSTASLKGCCCCLVLLFSFLALLSLAIILVIVLAIKPKKPQFDLQQVTVQYLNFATFTSAVDSPTSASLSLVLHMLFTAKNDNIAGIKYRDSTFNILYRGVPLGRGTVPGFYQAAHSVKKVQTTVSVDRVNLLQADAAELVTDASINDRVELRIMGDVIAKIRVIGITSPSVQVSVYPLTSF